MHLLRHLLPLPNLHQHLDSQTSGVHLGINSPQFGNNINNVVHLSKNKLDLKI